jgi:hypothetical protein
MHGRHTKSERGVTVVQLISGSWRAVGVLASFAVTWTLASSAGAAECPGNEAIREREVQALRLPDCRAYEQVTPVEKGGSNAAGTTGLVEAARAGEAITFFATGGLGGLGEPEFPEYLATRDGTGWSTSGLLLPVEPGAPASLSGWSEDLGAVLVEGETTLGSGLRGLYLGDTATGSYRLLFAGGATLADFTPDHQSFIFESEDPLLPNAAPGKQNLYEWSRGRLSLAGVLPGPGESAPPGGSFAGPDHWLTGETTQGGASGRYYTANTISSDGSRVFFTAGGTGQLYVRENGTTTLPIPGGHFDEATPDGGTVLVQAQDGSTLSEYDVAHEHLTQIAAGGIQGALGMSADGSYVYFVANAVLAANEGADGSHATSGNCAGVSVLGNGECNLYLWHDGADTFIARLTDTSSGGAPTDGYDWTPTGSVEGHDIERGARVTPAGTVLLFRSKLRLTSYPSAGQPELYRFDAPRGELACVSCDPSGAAAAGPAELAAYPAHPATASGFQFLTRNLSEDGSTVFFDSPDALVPGDTNGVRDVYEWEVAGHGSCSAVSATFSASSGGCLYLISTGTSPAPSWFADASASGSDAFLFTYQQLVGQDEDQLEDIYDARVGGGIAAQNPVPAPSCEGEGCRARSVAPPGLPQPASSAYEGPGNPPAAPPAGAPSHPAPRPSAAARRLAAALKACRRRPARVRARCAALARRRYANVSRLTGRGRR